MGHQNKESQGDGSWAVEPSEDGGLGKMRVRVSLPFLHLPSVLEAMLNHSFSKPWTTSGLLVMSGGGKGGEGSSKKANYNWLLWKTNVFWLEEFSSSVAELVNPFVVSKWGKHRCLHSEKLASPLAYVLQAMGWWYTGGCRHGVFNHYLKLSMPQSGLIPPCQHQFILPSAFWLSRGIWKCRESLFRCHND